MTALTALIIKLNGPPDQDILLLLATSTNCTVRHWKARNIHSASMNQTRVFVSFGGSLNVASSPSGGILHVSKYLTYIDSSWHVVLDNIEAPRHEHSNAF